MSIKPENQKIIAFTGKMGSGKTTAVDFLRDYFFEHKLGGADKGLKVVKFAAPLYDIQHEVYRVMGQPQPETKDRQLLQFIGTDWGRNNFGQDVWVDLWKEEVEGSLKAHKNLVCVANDDCRFENEALTIRELGGVLINIEAPEDLRADRITLTNTSHSSEDGIPNKYMNYTIHNTGSMFEFKNDLFSIFDRVFAPKVSNHHATT